MTIVEDTRHHRRRGYSAGMHVAAALDPIGGLLGAGEFPVAPAGYARLLGWLGGFGTVALVGIEGTGSYGAGLGPRHHRGRHPGRRGRPVRPPGPSRQGKSDPLDAVSAARAAQSGRARGAPKGRDGAVEAIRALMVAKRSARSERDQTINQARALVVTAPMTCAPGSPGTRPPAWSAAWRRCGPGSVSRRLCHPHRAARAGQARGVPRRPARAPGRAHPPLVVARAPGLLALHGVGPDTAALLLVAAGITQNGCARRPPGRTCARPPRSRHRRGKSPATASIPAATARPTTPYGGSCSPG